MSEKHYLNTLADKSEIYFEARNVALQFGKRHDLDSKLKADLVVLSQMWAAHHLGDTFTESDLGIRLNLKHDIESDKILNLTDGYDDMTLIELLEDYTKNDSQKI
jgi:uncharacterized protein YfeS